VAARQVRLRTLASADVETAIDHYRNERPALAHEFVDALEAALQQIRRSPGLGSLRYAFELGFPELRCSSLRRFPYLIFYVAHDDLVDVWRVLHQRRDIPAALIDP
jgi:toxin ParE1/3/4